MRPGQAQQEIREQRRIDQQQNPGPQDIGEHPLESGVEAPDIELVLEVEEEREHPERQENETHPGQDEAGGAGISPPAGEEEVAGDDHHSGDQPAKEEIDGNLPGPDLETGSTR
jgi:hypothetical protein